MVRGSRWGRKVAIATCPVLWLPAAMLADVPRQIHYQGKLRDASGTAVDAAASLRFRLYDNPDGTGTPLFDEVHGGVAVTRGLFSVLIGSQTGGGIPDSALDAPAVFLGVAINAGPELTPRTRIVSNPHAIKAKSAEQLVKPNTFDPIVTLDSGGALLLSSNSGATGQFLTSQGAGSPPIWSAASGGSSDVKILMPHPPMFGRNIVELSPNHPNPAWIGQVLVDHKILANSVSLLMHRQGVDETLRIAMYTDDGQTRLFYVSQLLTNDVWQSYSFTPPPEIEINPGVYWVAIIANSDFGAGIMGWDTPTSNDLSLLGPSGKPPISGRLTVSPGTLSSTINPASITPDSSPRTAIIRLDH